MLFWYRVKRIIYEAKAYSEPTLVKHIQMVISLGKQRHPIVNICTLDFLIDAHVRLLIFLEKIVSVRAY